MRRALFWCATIAVFAVTNGLIAHKERVLRSGSIVLLRLAPRDPRSLIQGDYMVLRYDLARNIPEEDLKNEPADGRLVVRLDLNGVARFVRIDRGEPLEKEELLLRYRLRGKRLPGGLRLGAESFFFQEGHEKHFARARYAALKVTASGESVLVGLRGENFEVLGPGQE